MKISTNIKLLLTATTIYLLFLARGLCSNHYLDWSIDFQIGDCLEIIIFTVPLAYVTLNGFSSKENYFRDSVWFALFLSVPFIIFDMLYLGLIKGYGLGYLSTFWFLTIFYFIVLMEVPVIGYLMQKDDPAITKKHLTMLLIAAIAWLLNRWEGSDSHHYLQWSLNMKIVRITNIALVLLSIAYGLLAYTSPQHDRLKDACLLAFYFSSIFFLFDFLYLGVSQGRGLGYVREYWFVAAFYPIFWIELPLIGWFMKRTARAVSTARQTV